MEEFPSNSKIAKTVKVESENDEPKKFEKIVEGRVIRKKKTLGSRFAETFFGDDSKTAAQYVLVDVLLPALKDMIADAVSQGAERMIFGESRSSGRRTTHRSGPVNYQRFSSPTSREERRPSMGRRERATHAFDNIVLATRVEAEDVLDRLADALEKYESVSVADLYALVGEDSDYTDEKWGWTSMRDARPRRRRDGGYLLDMPRPEPI